MWPACACHNRSGDKLKILPAQYFQAMMRVWITTAPKPTDFTNPGGSEAALSAWGL